MSHPKKPTDLGLNRTGLSTSPFDTTKLLATAEAVVPAEGDAGALAALRLQMSEQAPPVGSIPPPATLKGMAKSAMHAAMGHKVTVFIDKLGERLAFERTGTRLYDALLVKLMAGKSEAGSLRLEDLQRLREDEHRHMGVVRDAILKLGADPTVMTPCADLTGVKGLGLVQVLTDPRVTLTQALDAILMAELADNDGWTMLIALAEALEQGEIVKAFQQCLAEEDEHLILVRRWISERLEIQLGEDLPAAPTPM